MADHHDEKPQDDTLSENQPPTAESVPPTPREASDSAPVEPAQPTSQDASQSTSQDTSQPTPDAPSEILLDDSPHHGTEPISPLSPVQKEDLQSKIQTAKLVDPNQRAETLPTLNRNPLATLSSLTKHDPQNPDTAVLHAKSLPRRQQHPEDDTPLELIRTSEQREIILVIRGMVERLVMSDHKTIVLGRTDIKTRTMPNVDLTPYGALDRGVSREHCSLHIDGDKIFVTDLGSTNGTWLATERLIPHQPRQLRKGEELLLGRLPVQVLFR